MRGRLKVALGALGVVALAVGYRKEPLSPFTFDELQEWNDGGRP